MRQAQPQLDFGLGLDELFVTGRDLRRPECVLVQSDGVLWTSDDRGGVTRLDRDGAQTTIGNIAGTPNGLALDVNGDLLVCEIEHGGFYRLSPDGRSQAVLTNLHGQRLGAVNFVCPDPDGGYWITVSTRTLPRIEAIRRPLGDGYILRLDSTGARIVATGLCFPNELRLDANGRFAYLAESALGRVVRMRVQPNGGLGSPEPFGPQPLFEGAIVDGLAFDVLGGLWVTEVARNGLYRLAPDGACQRLIEDPSGAKLNFPSSIAFGGEDLKTAYIGSIKADHLVAFRSPVAGLPLLHWNTPSAGATADGQRRPRPVF